MSKLKVNELDTESGTTITVAAGKTIAGTDIIDTTQIKDDAVTADKLANSINNEIYHHVGIYSFRYETLKKFISIPPSKNEINRKLEQLSALAAKMTIGVSYVKDVPISVDTRKDLLKVEKIVKSLWLKKLIFFLFKEWVVLIVN